MVLSFTNYIAMSVDFIMLYIIWQVLLRVDSIIYLSSLHIYRMYTYVDDRDSEQ